MSAGFVKKMMPTIFKDFKAGKLPDCYDVYKKMCYNLAKRVGKDKFEAVTI